MRGPITQIAVPLLLLACSAPSGEVSELPEPFTHHRDAGLRAVGRGGGFDPPHDGAPRFHPDAHRVLDSPLYLARQVSVGQRRFRVTV